MINVGVDLGSTYTTVVVYNKVTGQLETILLGEGIPYIPSVVSYYKDTYEFGSAAKNNMGKKNARVFKAFKMLLTETDEEKLKERGYDKEHTPKKITEIFLKNLLEQVLQSRGETKIEHLVVGVPEVWAECLEQIDGRDIIRTICKGFDFVESVKVVSEPTCASAFFAYNYWQITGKNFDGNILLIDYGGGTLDINLSQVLLSKDNNVEIKTIDNDGAGENVDHEIGNAGIIYMEKVIQQALVENEILDKDEEVTRDGKFYKVVYALESDFQSKPKLIQDMFEEYGLDDIEGLDEEEFTELEYKGDDISISYGLLLRVYNEVIYPVLDEKLQKMKQTMDNPKYKIDYMNPRIGKFKIALVGGFGNYYLVKKQVEDCFKFGTQDTRTSNMINNQSDRERAIAMGAALLAENKIGIRYTAPYSIGVYMQKDGQAQYCYAFTYREEIDIGKEYYPKKENGDYIITMAAGDTIQRFVFNNGYDSRSAFSVYIKKEIQDKLKNLFQNQYHMGMIGFSIDETEILSIHVKDYDPLTHKESETSRTIRLARYADLFDPVMI